MIRKNLYETDNIGYCIQSWNDRVCNLLINNEDKTMTDLGHNDEREMENKEPIYIECETCEGMGGWDKSRDIEVYDDWEDCPDCEGTGEVLL